MRSSLSVTSRTPIIVVVCIFIMMLWALFASTAQAQSLAAAPSLRVSGVCRFTGLMPSCLGQSLAVSTAERFQASVAE